MAQKRSKFKQIVWIILTVVIGFTMILFSSGGFLLSGGGYDGNSNSNTYGN